MSNEPRSPRFPDFFLVGQPKCGTTAIYEIIRDHPEVFMPGHKEPNYFITDAHYRNTPETLEDYLELFEPAEPGQRIGEASVLYLASTTAAAGIAAHNPEARIIAILREPAALLRSFHQQLVESRVEVRGDLRAALEAEPARREGRRIHRGGADQAPMLFYSNHVRYVEQLRRVHEHFPPEQVLVLLYDEFRADNAAVIARILDFLGVQSSVELSASRANPSVRVRSPRLDQLVHSVSTGRGPVARLAKRGIVAATPQRVRRRALGAVEGSIIVAEQKAAPDLDLTAELRARYRPEVEALGEYLNRDVAGLWGYATDLDQRAT